MQPKRWFHGTGLAVEKCLSRELHPSDVERKVNGAGSEAVFLGGLRRREVGAVGSFVDGKDAKVDLNSLEASEKDGGGGRRTVDSVVYCVVVVQPVLANAVRHKKVEVTEVWFINVGVGWLVGVSMA